MFRSLRTEQVADRVAEQLKRVLREGLFKPGDRLPSERDLAEQMGVSRPSVREAIQQLEMLGMLEPIHGMGTVVKNLTEQEISKPLEALLEGDRHSILEMTEVRACLESWAALRAAQKRTKSDLDLIHGYLEAMEQDLERGRIRAELDFLFHAAIGAAAHNRILLHLMHSIHDLMKHCVKVYREEVFVDRMEQEMIFGHHLRVFKAIQSQDPSTAQAAMKEHLEFVITEYRRRFLPDEPGDEGSSDR